MRILVITNLFPPQELGGYGRCIADYVTGLVANNNYVEVLASDAPYLQNFPTIVEEPGVNPYVIRRLQLQGSYDGGVSLITNSSEIKRINSHNVGVCRAILNKGFDGILFGNIDLLGNELLQFLVSTKIPVVHHAGFVTPPFDCKFYPHTENYLIVGASSAVRTSLVEHGFPISNNPIIFPGVRHDLFTPKSGTISDGLQRALSFCSTGRPIGSTSNPLKIGYAGLLMTTKGPQLVVDSAIQLSRLGYCVQVSFAGFEFQKGLKQYFEQQFRQLSTSSCSWYFYGQLSRIQLSRFWSLQHIGIFPSIFPEAFGIVGAEIMASGLVLISSGVGGSSELYKNGVSGLTFESNSSASITSTIQKLLNSPSRFADLASNASTYSLKYLNVQRSVNRIEHLFEKYLSTKSFY